MAVTVRIPEDLDSQLEKLATEEHVSKHALLLRGARIVVEHAARRDVIDEGLDFVLSHDAEVLGRLAHA